MRRWSDHAVQQAPSRVVVVRPHHFRPNDETAHDNVFQRNVASSWEEIRIRAHDEVTALAEALRGIGVGVDLFEDTGEATPDSVFPNNWFTTHANGLVALYPMYAPSRRAERRSDIIDQLKARHHVRKVVDYSGAEVDGWFCEGTGAMVIDHVSHVVYACRSRRLTPHLFDEVCADLGLTPVLFDAVDRHGVPVYHTNVLMSVATDVALIGSEMIRDDRDRSRVLATLWDSGKTIVELTEDQVGSFAGNCLEVSGRDGRHLVMSATAAAALTPAQHAAIAESTQVLTVDVSTIEAAGGSVRCMLAGNHLRERDPDAPGAPVIDGPILGSPLGRD